MKVERALTPQMYTEGSKIVAVSLDEKNQAIWATALDISKIFDITESTTNNHIQDIYNSNESLDRESTSRIFQKPSIIDGRTVLIDVTHYNIDIVFAIGYRTNSRKASNFRDWATRTLSSYAENAYVIDKKRLLESPEQLNKLAAEIRELRFSEKSVYQAVRDCFKIASSDYQNNEIAKRFFYTLQDKLHYAITGMTASKLKEDRVSAKAKNMGVITFSGEIPTLKEAKVGKNLLDKKELYRLHLLSETFLIFAEMMADREIKMTMGGLQKKIDELLAFNEYPVFSTYDDFPNSKSSADKHVEREYDYYIEMLKLRSIGVPVDMDLFYEGEYNEYKETTSQITLPQLKKTLLVE